MEHSIPTIDDVRAVLARMTMEQIGRLGALSGVPPTTIYKIKRGETENPGIETVRKFMPHVEAALRKAA
jgi:predicted transcriptional regulator